MMVHSVTQGHLRHQWFSMHKVDAFSVLTLRGNMVLGKYLQHLLKIDTSLLCTTHIVNTGVDQAKIKKEENYNVPKYYSLHYIMQELYNIFHKYNWVAQPHMTTCPLPFIYLEMNPEHIDFFTLIGSYLGFGFLHKDTWKYGQHQRLHN